MTILTWVRKLNSSTSLRPAGRSNRVRCSITPTRKVRKALRKVSSQNNQADRRSPKGRMARPQSKCQPRMESAVSEPRSPVFPLHRQLCSSSLREIGGMARREIRSSFENLAA
jgi:hypothetical protein